MRKLYENYRNILDNYMGKRIITSSECNFHGFLNIYESSNYTGILTEMRHSDKKFIKSC